jgi:ABC-type transporter MlaC component
MTKTMRKLIGVLAIGLLTTLMVTGVFAHGQTNQNRAHNAVAYLRNILTTQSSANANQLMMQRIIKQFDMRYFCKTVLPSEWGKLNQQQQSTFEVLMQDKIAHTLSFIFAPNVVSHTQYTGVTVWKGTPIIVVRTHVKRKKWPVYPITYYLQKNKNSYRLVDIRIYENSLIDVYRSQMTALLKQYSWPKIMRLLQGHVDH